MCSVTGFSEDFSFILGLSFDSFGFMFVVGNFVLFFFADYSFVVDRFALLMGNTYSLL